MRQLVVISGKGGTGKTSLVAAFAALSTRAVLADCDVDAADLHLVLQPSTVYRELFSSAKRATIDATRCTRCGVCEDLCRFGAISNVVDDAGQAVEGPAVDPVACEGCGVCAWFCDEAAIDLVPVVSGEWFLSETRHGPMVHARLAAAAENSGKLVSLVRSQARITAQTRNLDLVVIDGAPGIGCPVIASITGADLVLVVTEPTLSGLHDLGRVISLTEHFEIPAMVLVNKFDVNEELSSEAEEFARARGARIAGRVRYDDAVTEAQIRGLSVVEHSVHGAAADIVGVWETVVTALGMTLADENTRDEHE
jgi:MinD superfamily P-loop ATPase